MCPKSKSGLLVEFAIVRALELLPAQLGEFPIERLTRCVESRFHVQQVPREQHIEVMRAGRAVIALAHYLPAPYRAV